MQEQHESEVNKGGHDMESPQPQRNSPGMPVEMRGSMQHSGEQDAGASVGATDTCLTSCIQKGPASPAPRAQSTLALLTVW